jgi:phage terminase large subunit GpA-like protein
MNNVTVDTSHDVIVGFIDGLRPVRRMTVSQWADTYRVLSSVSSSEPGKWRTSRVPYLREPQDMLSSSSGVEKIVVMKGAQLAFTEMAFNLMGYTIDLDPGPMLYVLPTELMVKRNSTTRFDPMVNESETLRLKVKPEKTRSSANNMFQKNFPGGSIILAGANSPATLRNASIRYLLLDETDAYPIDLDGEGSPIGLAMARTRNFKGRRKIFLLSTPTIEGVSVIDKEFQQTDQRYYFVPCPHCGAMQRLRWERMRWEKGDYSNVRYQCEVEGCEELIEERFKTSMLEGGEWRATRPDKANPKVVGYHISSLYSPFGWYGWDEAALDWDEAQNDVTKLKTFINTVLGETWKQTGEAPPWKNIFNRREDYKMSQPHADTAFLTCGVDVQKDRIELEIVGWCKGKRTYSVDYRVLNGATDSPEVWDELAKVVNEQFVRTDNTVMPLRLMAIDTGYNTPYVYAFCRRFPSTRVVPIKGQDGLKTYVSTPKMVDVGKSGKKIDGLKRWDLGVSVIKEETYGYLMQEHYEGKGPPPGYCHFPMYGEHYFKGLTAEKLTFKIVKGYRKYEWVNEYGRNEPLDCRVYARGAASIVGIDRMQEHHFDEYIKSYPAFKPDGIVIEKKAKPPKKGGHGLKRRDGGYWDNR